MTFEKIIEYIKTKYNINLNSEFIESFFNKRFSPGSKGKLEIKQFFQQHNLTDSRLINDLKFLRKHFNVHKKIPKNIPDWFKPSKKELERRRKFKMRKIR